MASHEQDLGEAPPPSQVHKTKRWTDNTTPRPPPSTAALAMQPHEGMKCISTSDNAQGQEQLQISHQDILGTYVV